MQIRIIITAFLIIASVTLKAQEKLNVVLSFRPNIGVGSSTEMSDKQSGFFTKSKTKSTKLNVNFSVDFFSKKEFYHFPLVGFKMLHSIRNSETIENDVTRRDIKKTVNRTSAWLGYGIGKYFYIYKENIFLNLKNSIALKYSFGYSSDFNNGFDINGNKRFKTEAWNRLADSYGLIYELNPSLGYKLKNFSLSLGLPLSFGLGIINGKQKESISIYDFVYETGSYKETYEKHSSTAFNFGYSLELGLRYHVPYKKKEKK